MFTVLGTCDNVTTCDCCGRDGLKRTVALDNGAGVTFYGTTCASKASKRSAGYITRKARGKAVLACEECGTCSDAVRYVGSLGRVLCHTCVDRHTANMLGMTYAEFVAR